MFSTKISDASITAVCCEEEDDVDNPIFYAGDSDGRIPQQSCIYRMNLLQARFTLSTRRVTLLLRLWFPTGLYSELIRLIMTICSIRKGEIHILANRGKYSLYAYTSNGTTSFSRATSDFRYLLDNSATCLALLSRKGNFSTSSSNYSYDGDGTFHRKMGAGDYKVDD